MDPSKHIKHHKNPILQEQIYIEKRGKVHVFKEVVGANPKRVGKKHACMQ